MDMQKRVIALGFFDGIHRGHGALLEQVNREAARLGAHGAVLTFDTHPDSLVRGEAVPLINSAECRVDLIRRLYGIADTIFIHFNDAMMHMPWQEFAQSIVEELGACHLVVGHDFRFGYKGEGTAERLRDFCANLDVGCGIIPAVQIEGITVSSTYIRSLLRQGDMERARLFLGHPHTLVDTVHHGYKFGRTIGAPTINMAFPEGVLVPFHGVYAAKVFIRGESGTRAYMAITNIGVRPTVSGENKVSVESFILDYSGNLYGQEVRVEFYKLLRPEMKFGSVEELKNQIQKDAAATRRYFEALVE